MSINSQGTKPGIAHPLLLLFIAMLFYIEVKKMPLECLMQTRMNQLEKLHYNPSFILIPDIDFCKNHTYLFIYQTRVEDIKGRSYFRKNIGGNYSEKYNFKILFPLGLSLNATINEDVAKEHKQYGDILQANFLDTYRNLTLKTYTHSRYVSQNCANIRAVVKVDDDIAWNIRLMFDYLSTDIDPETNALYCLSVTKPLVDRNKSSKWYISIKEYPYKYFPQYCLSPIYIATPSTIKMLHDETKNVPFVWLDDVFSTGIVGREIGITFKPLAVNVYSQDYSPFLNRTVIAQYLRKMDDFNVLLEALNVNNSAFLLS